jgi:hypothetical protein
MGEVGIAAHAIGEIVHAVVDVDETDPHRDGSSVPGRLLVRMLGDPRNVPICHMIFRNDIEVGANLAEPDRKRQ